MVSNKQMGAGFGLDKRDKMNSMKPYKRVGFKNHFFESDVADLMI